jgi:hypothetical protein
MASLSDILAQLDGKAVLTAEDALALRRLIWGEGSSVTPTEAEALVRLNRDAGQASPEWAALYVEALTDFVVRQQSPEGYVDPAKADWLIAAVSSDGVGRPDEVELLIHVLEAAEEVPASLSAFVLQALMTAILARAGAGGITREEVERLRRVLFAAGGEDNVAVTRHEAEALFQLNDAFHGAANDPAWTELFVRAVANSVLYVAAWHEPSGQEALRRQAWLSDTRLVDQLDFGKALHDPLGTFLAPAPNLTSHWGNPFSLKDPVTFTSDEDARYAADAALEAQAQKVTFEEARWLLDRIGRDGHVDANEQALIRFLADNASGIDPSLHPLIEHLRSRPVRTASPAGPASPELGSAAQPAFGHRAHPPG